MTDRRHRRFRSRSRKTPTWSGFHRIVVAIGDNRESQQAVDTGCRLANDRGGRVTLIAAVEVPVELPLDCQMDTADRQAQELLERAQATADSYGIKTRLRLVHAREAATAIVEELERQEAELAIVGVPHRSQRRVTHLGRTVEAVLKSAPCRVMLVIGTRDSLTAASGRAGHRTRAGRRA